jgi:hypothetical protein
VEIKPQIMEIGDICGGKWENFIHLAMTEIS